MDNYSKYVLTKKQAEVYLNLTKFKNIPEGFIIRDDIDEHSEKILESVKKLLKARGFLIKEESLLENLK